MAVKRSRRVVLLGAAVWLLTVPGCVRVPPTLVTRDRFDYGQAIAESWKRQTLINVVRIRYADAPVFLEVTSLINSYTLSGTANAGATVRTGPDQNEFGAGVSGSFSNTPTVTYQPVT